MKVMAWAGFIALIVVPGLACSQSALKMQIVELPPYMVVNSNGDISGLVVDRVAAAFKKAGISTDWQVVPAARQLQLLKQNKERLCSVGWYKTPEREKFAKFSRAILRDSAYVGIANKKYNPPNGVTIDAVLADSQTAVLIKSGFVYGDFLDAKFAAMQAKREISFGDMPQIFKMIAAGRAQITFAPLDEIQYYVNIGLIDKGAINILSFSEMPQGYNRYLMCSQNVEDDVLNKFDMALQN
jgi:uncharacterized protein (TIGR02285 family)